MSDSSFNYMLLGRLQQDCEFYLNCGNRNTKYLWADSPKEQIEKMRELYNGFKDKPKWISLKNIEEYENRMINHDLEN